MNQRHVPQDMHGGSRGIDFLAAWGAAVPILPDAEISVIPDPSL